MIALEIAKRGGAVHLVCRNEERGKAAADDIRTATNNEVGSISIVTASHVTGQLDLSRLLEFYSRFYSHSTIRWSHRITFTPWSHNMKSSSPDFII